MEFLKLLFPAALSCMLNAIANVFWKFELNRNPLNGFDIPKLAQLFLSLNIITGILCYIGSMILFFYLLSHFKLSVIIPIMALTYIFNLLSAYLIFHEKLSIYSVLGTFVVILGILIISRAPISAIR